MSVVKEVYNIYKSIVRQLIGPQNLKVKKKQYVLFLVREGRTQYMFMKEPCLLAERLTAKILQIMMQARDPAKILI